jgi:Ca-activated chloride channel family protein
VVEADIMSWTYVNAFYLLAVPLVLLVLTVAWFRWKSRLLAESGDAAVLARLIDAKTPRQQGVKALFLLLGLVLLVLALAGPRWGQQFQEVHRRGVDVLIAMDVSSSMLAEDVKPNQQSRSARHSPA